MPVPKISVLIPTYRYAGYLKETLDSVLSQESADFEVIVSDDCSGDGTAELIAGYAARDPRVRAHVHLQNIGMVQNWNWCLRESRGEYIKYVFGDDMLAEPRALAKMSAMLDANPRAVLAACARNVIDEHSRVTEVWSHLGTPGVQHGGNTVWRCLSGDINIVGEPTAVMFRRSAGIRGFSERYDQLVDLEMWCHLLCGGALVYSDEPLCCFRCHALQRTEFNRARGIHSAEMLQLTHEYYSHPALRGQGAGAVPSAGAVLFARIYRTRKSARHDPAALEQRALLMSVLGRPSYCTRWLWRKITNPFASLARSIAKRRVRSGKNRPLTPRRPSPF
jgi:hypothetical protein